MTEVSGIDDDSDIGVRARNALEYFHSGVLRTIVDEDVLVAIASQPGHYSANAVV